MVNDNKYGLIHAFTCKSWCIFSVVKENPGNSPNKISAEQESRQQEEGDSLCVQSLWSEDPTPSTLSRDPR